MNKLLDKLHGRNAGLKQQILGLCLQNDMALAEISKELNASIPTVTKLVSELIEDNFLVDMGKQHGSSGGRRPSFYGLNPAAGQIVGVEVGRESLALVAIDFKGQVIARKDGILFRLESTKESFNALADVIRSQVRSLGISPSDLLACGITLSGRVNASSGYSFTYFISEERPLTDILSERLGVPVFIENDSRAMAYGEYLGSHLQAEKNILFFNVSWGLGMGMILDGKLHYGKSGFSGEIGHFPTLDNNVVCQCGKVGCLETCASGSAAHRILMESISAGKASVLQKTLQDKGDFTLEDIITAVKDEDVQAIEVMEEIGANLGKAIAGVINIFNPDLVVLGGRLTEVGDYLMLPVKTAISKHSLNIVSRDTRIQASKLGRSAGPVGVCLLSRSRMLGLL